MGPYDITKGTGRGLTENRTDKKMEHEAESGIVEGFQASAPRKGICRVHRGYLRFRIEDLRAQGLRGWQA